LFSVTFKHFTPAGATETDQPTARPIDSTIPTITM
jgi:hypothetical protein